MARRRGPPRFSEIDGRVAGDGWAERLHAPPEGDDCPLRSGAGGVGARQAAFLRHGDDAGRLSDRLAGRKPRSRPTKVEGNPDHPASLGATDVFAQASVLTLYDPDRSQVLTYLEDIRPWSALLGQLRVALDGLRARGGAGLRILTETVSSRTLA